MLTQEDLQSIKGLLETQSQQFESKFERLEQKMDSGFQRLEQRMDGLEQRMDGLEQRMDDMENRQDSMESYMHRKFALIENDLIPKVNALYEAADLYVKQMDCRKRNEEVESKLDYIAPLVEITQSNSRKLERYDTILKELAAVT